MTANLQVGKLYVSGTDRMVTPCGAVGVEDLVSKMYVLHANDLVVILGVNENLSTVKLLLSDGTTAVANLDALGVFAVQGPDLCGG